MNCKEMSDESVVKQVLSDHNFFYCIIEHYEQRLRTFVYRQSGLSASEVDDILQEAFLKVYRNLRGFDFDLKFQSWIYRIVRNATIDYLRRNDKHRRHISGGLLPDDDRDLIETIASSDDLIDSLEIQVDAERLAEIVSSLPDLYRDVAILRFWEDKDYSEISDIIQKPLGTVGSLVSRSRGMIIDQFKKGVQDG